MATTAWSAFLPHIISEAHELAEPLAELHIKEAVIDFCQRSWCWVIDHGFIDVETETSTYNLAPPANTQIARILRVWYDKYPLYARSTSWLSGTYGDWTVAPGAPEFFVQEVHDQLIVVPQPTEDFDEGLALKVALKPTRAATGFETKIADRHWDALVGAAKGRIFAMPRKPWSDATLAGFYKEQTEQAIARARLDIQRGLVSARLRVPAHFF